jgi:ribosomal-protein-alanine N-acetyltransferase
VIVRGPNVSLRYATPDDARALFEIGSDPEVVRFFSWGPYRDAAEPLPYIESLERQRADGTRLEFLVVDRDDRPIGVTGWSDFSLRDRRAIVGTWFGRPFWGTGANRESKALVLALGFRRLGLIRATALASPDNARSLAALERLGFAREGVLRAWQVHGGERRDVAILRLLREDFESGPLAEVPVEFEGEPPPQFVADGD